MLNVNMNTLHCSKLHVNKTYRCRMTTYENLLVSNCVEKNKLKGVIRRKRLDNAKKKRPYYAFWIKKGVITPLQKV